MTSQSIVALFTSVEDANAAIRDLEGAGIPSSDLELHASPASSVNNGTLETTGQSHGFFAWLFGNEASNDESHVYRNGVQAGGAAVAVHLTGGAIDHAVHEILHRHNPVDIDEKLDASRPSATMSAGTGAMASPITVEPVKPVLKAGSTNEEIVIPIVEEELTVGKREVERGRVRVRTYTREIPVEESVDLRSRWVAVEHRPVAYGAAVSADAFQDKTIDLVETAEEAVVAKTARVTDEVVIRQGTEQHAETIRDTVRKTEIDVQRDDSTINAGTVSKPVRPVTPVEAF